MLHYLDWLRQQMLPEPFGMSMDQFGTHTTEAVINKAEVLEIEVIRNPNGATGRYQPLDRRTFGALKAKVKAKWGQKFAEHYGMASPQEVAAELLLQSWGELSDFAVTARWDYGEELDEEKESDDSDGEFHLHMAAETDDEDIIAVRSADGEDAESESIQLDKPR
jgi:hypothetical protein